MSGLVSALGLGAPRAVGPERQGLQAPAQRDEQAVGEESNEDVRFDPLLVLGEDRPDGEAALEVPEGLFDGDALDKYCRSRAGSFAVRFRRSRSRPSRRHTMRSFCD